MEQYTIRMDNFEGPLDLLCQLIEKNKMDIFDIKIALITDQYMEYLKEMQRMNLDITSEFIVMASKLIYLKSKSDDIDDPLVISHHLKNSLIRVFWLLTTSPFSSLVTFCFKLYA